MTLNNIGVVHTCEEATIRINDAMSPLKQSMVTSILDRVQPRDENADEYHDHTINNARIAFIIIESFWIDIEEWKVENSIRRYWETRNGNTIAERWELFCHLVSDSEWGFVFSSYTATRPTHAMETENEPAKKKQSSPS